MYISFLFWICCEMLYLLISAKGKSLLGDSYAKLLSVGLAECINSVRGWLSTMEWISIFSSHCFAFPFYAASSFSMKTLETGQILGRRFDGGWMTTFLHQNPAWLQEVTTSLSISSAAKCVSKSQP